MGLDSHSTILWMQAAPPVALASHQWCDSTACDAGARLCFTAGGHWRCMRQPIGYLVILHNLCVSPRQQLHMGQSTFLSGGCGACLLPPLLTCAFSDTVSALDVQHLPGQ